ncbi:hypothetical protein TD95_004637 [Thielaviopsis punctulata]|uniref:Fumarate reductase n=1 Tax=Thielaviopsis punctulata TaxID=72032 RepID=A0A0F4ZKE5_9PEZI|nr:hypothetical protein TD95_004637 [Thielaviopsis punctulata]
MTRRRFAQASLFAISIAIFAMLTRLTAPSTLKASLSSFTMSSSKPPVIVIGSGLAGLAAAYSALQSGASSVHMLDRAATPGGNSIKASSGINGAGTRFQAAAGIPDDPYFLADTITSAGARYATDALHPDAARVDRPALLATLVAESARTLHWLADDLGVDLRQVTRLGGHSVARTHRGTGRTPPGAALVGAFLERLRDRAGFTLTSAATVTRLTTALDGAVTGVEYVLADGATARLAGPVVVAAGGFAGDAEGLMKRYRPDLAGLPATAETRPGAQDLVVAVGAELVDMDSVQVHPTGFVASGARGAMSKFLAAEMLRGEGGILLDAAGRRFVNEMDLRSVVSGAIMRLPREEVEDAPGIRQWNVTLLLDPGASQAAAGHLGFYTWKGLMQRKKISELSPAVRQTLAEYAEIAAGNRKDPLGRSSFGQWALKPGEDWSDLEVHVGQVTPVVHFTMGGVAFDTKARVLKKKEEDDKMQPIAGLFAAGEITGGIHGDNRLGGSSLLECAVYGRIAGKSAAASI